MTGKLERYAFRMRLKPGMKTEYKARHDAIWPGLVTLLREAGVSDYSIYLDDETDSLFALLHRPADHTMDRLAEHPVMRKWWASMADLMETKPDDEPVAVPLELMFQMD